MKVAIELHNSLGCALDSQIVEVAEGDDLATAIASALIDFVSSGEIAIGDTIRIAELP